LPERFERAAPAKALVRPAGKAVPVRVKAGSSIYQIRIVPSCPPGFVLALLADEELISKVNVK
jgi:hypothetical protein